MWYDSSMPIERSNPELVSNAEDAVVYAQAVRKAHRRRTRRGTPQREADIRIALERLARAMRPIRRRIARIPYLRVTDPAEDLRAASQEIQKERRKLWKLKLKG
jgi:hypothetical protein